MTAQDWSFFMYPKNIGCVENILTMMIIFDSIYTYKYNILKIFNE